MVEQLEDRRLLTAMPQSPVSVIWHDGPTVCTVSIVPTDDATLATGDSAASVSAANAATAAPFSSRLVEVSTATEFQDALDNALEGDEIVLAPGTYAGRFTAEGLSQVTIRSEDPGNRAVIDAAGVGEGLKLTSVTQVTVADLIVKNASANGVNIDDGRVVAGSTVVELGQISTHVTLRNLRLENGSGNGIKLAGVDHFHVDRASVIGWSSANSAISMVGCHFGLVERSYFEQPSSAGAGTGVQTKGGSSDITIRANRFWNANERSIQIGGSTEPQFFRPYPAGTVEASGTVAEGNFIYHNGRQGWNIRSAVSFVSVTDGTFRNNIVYRPSLYGFRILGGDPYGLGLLDTRNGVVSDNIVYWHQGDFLLGWFGEQLPVDYSSNTVPASFTYDGNQWYNATIPAESQPDLSPATETNGTYGTNPQIAFIGPTSWNFPWGEWLVNTSNVSGAPVPITPPPTYRLATPALDATLDIGAANPLTGSWTLTPVTTSDFTVEPFSYAVLVNSTVPDPPDVLIDDVTVSEGDGVAQFTVTLTSTSLQETTLTLTTMDDSAVAPDDYTATTGQVTIPAGSTTATATFDVPITDDLINEPEESFTVLVQSVDAGYVGDVNDEGTGVIEDDDVPPQIVSVEVSSVTTAAITGWSTDFLNEVDPDDGSGYPVPHGPDQLNSLTWVNMNRILVEFSKDVDSIESSEVHLGGINLADYSALIDDVSYESSTQLLTISLNSVLTADRLTLQIDDTVTDLDGNALDGEWTNGDTVGSSGDGLSGGSFLFEMNVLPGDVYQEGIQQGEVNIIDTFNSRNRQFQSIGTALYLTTYDVNGDGFINIVDTFRVRERQFTSLPPASAPATAAVDELFLNRADPPSPGAEQESGVPVDELVAPDAIDPFIDELVLVSGGRSRSRGAWVS